MKLRAGLLWIGLAGLTFVGATTLRCGVDAADAAARKTVQIEYFFSNDSDSPAGLGILRFVKTIGAVPLSRGEHVAETPLEYLDSGDAAHDVVEIRWPRRRIRSGFEPGIPRFDFIMQVQTTNCPPHAEVCPAFIRVIEQGYNTILFGPECALAFVGGRESRPWDVRDGGRTFLVRSLGRRLFLTAQRETHRLAGSSLRRCESG